MSKNATYTLESITPEAREGKAGYAYTVARHDCVENGDISGWCQGAKKEVMEKIKKALKRLNGNACGIKFAKHTVGSAKNRENWVDKGFGE